MDPVQSDSSHTENRYGEDDNLRQPISWQGLCWLLRWFGWLKLRGLLGTLRTVLLYLYTSLPYFTYFLLYDRT